MDCPYCAEEIKEQALVCKHCGRDISVLVLRGVLDRLQDAESRLDAAENAIHTLGAHVETLPHAERPVHPLAVSRLAAVILEGLVLPILLLWAAHGLIIAVLDLNTWVLRLVSILIPLPFGLRRHSSLRAALWTAAVIATVSVTGMLATTSLTDHVPMLPKGSREWGETLQYMASIGLAYLVGSLVAWRFDARGGSRPGAKTITRELAILLARSASAEPQSKVKLEHRVAAIAGWINTIFVVATSIATVLTALGHFFT